MALFYEIMEAIFIVVDSIFILYFLAKFLGFNEEIKYKKLKIGIFFIVLTALTLLLDVFPKQEGIITIAGIGTTIMYSIVCLKGNKYLRVVSSIAMFILIGIVSGIILCIYPWISNKSIDVIMQSGTVDRVICASISKIFLWIICTIIYLCVKKEKIELAKSEWIIMITMFSAMCVQIIVNVLMINDKQDKMIYQIMSAIMMMLFILTTGIVCYLVSKISAYNNYLLEDNLVRLQLEEKSKNIKDMEKYYKELKVLEHDVKHHYTIINTLLAENNIDKAKKYMEEFMDGKLSRSNLPIVVNGSVVNAILSSKYNECKEKNIECSAMVTGQMPEYMEMDISIILANLVDNAIMACQQEEKPCIDLEIYKEKNYINIEVKNKISESVLVKNPKLHTTQKDKKKHGIGLLSVKSTVDKHNGMLDYYEEDGKFVVKVVLKIEYIR